MRKEGYSPATIKDRSKTIKRIAQQLGTLLDADAVKDWVARLPIRGGSKLNILKAYACYCKWKGSQFEFPRVPDTEPALPFIPLESELDTLIDGSGRKLSAFQLTLKETGARAGEVMRLQWTDLDTEAPSTRFG